METSPQPAQPLLERTAEKKALSDAVLTAQAGGGRLVLIEGEAGCGKTSLLYEVERLAAAAPTVVLRARGAEVEHEFAFGGVRQLFDPLLSDPLRAPTPGDDVGQLFGAVPAGRSQREAGSQFTLLHALYWWLVRLADQGPLVLVVDDVQWLDPPSLRFLGFLARRLERLPVAMIVASRPADSLEQGQLWADLGAVPQAVRLRPAPLSEQAVTAVVAGEFAAAPADDFARACWQTTNGNALFVRELVQLLHSRGIAPDRSGVATVRASGPVAVATHVQTRLARQSASVRRLAEAIAVLGPQTPLPVAAAVASLSFAEAEESADRLTRLGLVSWQDNLSYSHPLLQAAVYEALSPLDRNRAHAAAATALRQAGAPAERQAAHVLHLSPAGDAGRLSLLVETAALARQRCAVDTAAVYLLRAAQEPPPAEVQSEIYRQLGNSEAYTLKVTAAETHLRQAVDLAGTGYQRALCGYSLGRLLEACARPVEATEALQAAVRQLGEGEAPGLRTRLEAELVGYCRLIVADRDPMLGYLRVLESRDPGDWGPLPFVLHAHQAMELACAGQPARHVIATAEAALGGEHLAPDLSALFIAIYALVAGGSYDSASRHLERAAARALRQGLAVAVSLCRAYQSVTCLWSGDLAETRLYLELDRLTADIPDHAALLLAGCETEVLIEQGDLPGAGRTLRQYAPTAQEYGSAHALPLIYARGRFELASGDAHAAERTFAQLGDRYRRWGADRLVNFSWRCGQARALHLLGARAGAPRALGHALRTCAELSTAAAALALAEEAVAVLEQSQARLELAHAQAGLGRLLLAADDRAGGRDRLRAAWELAVDCQASGLAQQLRRLLGQAGGRPPRLRTTGMAALTPSERRTARLAAKDMTNREIARELYITEKTVEGHISRIYRKLRIRSRPELIAVMSLGDTGDS